MCRIYDLNVGNIIAEGSIIRSKNKVSINEAQRKTGYQAITTIHTDRFYNKTKCICTHDCTIYPYSMEFNEFKFNFWQLEKGDNQVISHMAYDVNGGRLISTGNDIIINNGFHILSVVKFKRISEGPIRIVCQISTTNLYSLLFKTGFDEEEFNHNTKINLFSYSFIIPKTREFENIEVYADGIECEFISIPGALKMEHTIKGLIPNKPTKYSFIDKCFK